MLPTKRGGFTDSLLATGMRRGLPQAQGASPAGNSICTFVVSSFNMQTARSGCTVSRAGCPERSTGCFDMKQQQVLVHSLKPR